MGCAADPWRAAETWIRCLASHSVPLHAKARVSAHPDVAHLPAEPGIWDPYDRSWRSRSAIRQSSCSRPRLDRASCRCATKVRDGFRRGLIEPLLTLHGLRPYRSANRTARRDPRSGCMPVPRPPTTLRRGNWTMADRRPSPYRSRASPTPKLPAFANLHHQPLWRAQAGPHPTTRSHWSAKNNPRKKLMIVMSPHPPAPPLRVSSRGQGYEEPQVSRISSPESGGGGSDLAARPSLAHDDRATLIQADDVK